MALEALINAYELANAQTILVDRQDEIEKFNVAYQQIGKAYTDSLEKYDTVILKTS
jgi:hypothetical protein